VSTAANEIRRKSLENLWFFNGNVIGWPDVDNPFHKRMCATRQRWYREPVTLELYPRGHLKSSCLTVGYDSWEICRNPNIRIALFNGQFATGRRLLRDTRRQFSHNPRMRAVFPELCTPVNQLRPLGRQWSDNAFEVPGRTLIGEATCTLVTYGSSGVSQHFDLLNFDDMLDKDHVRTKELRDKHEEWFYECFQLRHDPGTSRIRQVGTFWHHDDTYRRQIRKEVEALKLGKPPSLRYLICPIETRDGIYFSPWQERFTHPVIEKIRQELRSVDGSDYTFNCNYLLNPTPAEQAVLRWERVRHCLRTDLAEPYANYVAVYYRVDKDEGRYDALVLVSVDSHGRIYLRKAWTGVFTPHELLTNLAFLTKSYHLDGVFLPSKLMVETLEPAMEAVSHRGFSAIPFEEVDRPDTTRTSRILALEPVITRGLLTVVDGFQKWDDLKEECEQMSATGSLGHDVLLVCLADFARFAGRPHRPQQRYPLPGTWAEAFPWPPTHAQRQFRNWNPVDEALGLQ
jgi:hypothetical protein